MSGEETGAVKVHRERIQAILDKASEVKPDGNIEPPLTEADLGERIWHLNIENSSDATGHGEQTSYAAVETAFREKFYDLIATTSINDPSFINVWNLLDIVSIYSDNEQCEPGLIFWLIEELLDSQTIDGCRKVFDYLESRREINTMKHFKQKSLIILRSCNELLRRLSRAEDTVFCGRVFIYLFQSFPLGDKSSVNLRGEFHTENVTTFDETSKVPKDSDVVMSRAENDEQPQPVDSSKTVTGDNLETDDQPAQEGPSKTPAVVVSDTDAPKSEETIDLDTLYPVFWGLQAFFSSPTRLFHPEHFRSFRDGLDATLSAFKRVNTDLDTRMSAKAPDETRRNLKRKRDGEGVEISSSFNPKYLTSRELFDLEFNDIAFRRHVLVQALILLDFILSLTPKARSRLPKLTNKAVLYNFTVDDENAKWASDTRDAIAEYLQQGTGGKFYYRMVDTVLSRDKNWVRWKVENCPPIERPPISEEDYTSALGNAMKVYVNKRLRPSPMGSLDLKFLSDGESVASLDRLREQDRFTTPAPNAFLVGIMDDDMDIDMAQSNEDKENAKQARASKVWRTLRLASRTKLSSFDKIDDGKNIQALFESPVTGEDVSKVTSEAEPPSQVLDEDNKIKESSSGLEQDSSEIPSQTDTQPSAEVTAS